MGFSGISATSLLLILIVVLIVFGPKRLKNLGHELGGALKSFRSAISNEDNPSSSDENTDDNKKEQ